MSSSCSSSNIWTEFRKKHPGPGRVPKGWYPADMEDELSDEDEYGGDIILLSGEIVDKQSGKPLNVSSKSSPPAEIVIMDGKPVSSDKPIYSL